jgi:hypothetical protein
MGKEAGTWSWSSVSNVEVKNEWNHTSIPPMYLHGLDRDSFTFLSVHVLELQYRHVITAEKTWIDSNTDRSDNLILCSVLCVACAWARVCRRVLRKVLFVYSREDGRPCSTSSTATLTHTLLEVSVWVYVCPTWLCVKKYVSCHGRLGDFNRQ